MSTMDINHITYLAGLAPDQDVSDPFSHLTGTMEIAGMPFYVQALQVVIREDGTQVAADPDWQDQFDGMALASLGDGHFQTLSAFGREYVVYITPYCV